MSELNTELTKKSIKAGTWLAGYRFFARFINLLKTPIIARILTPAQFGVFGVVSIALNLFETFSETGLEQALIHKKKLRDKDINTAWLITCVRSLLISGGLFFSAPYVASFFSMPETIPMIQVIAMTPILRSLRNPSMIYLKRKLEFMPETIMLSLGSITEVVTAVSLTLAWQSEWALVWAIVAGATIEVIASYLLFPRPKITGIDLGIAKELLHFGKWIWSSSVLSYLANQGDDIIVGRVLGAAPLGLYQNAYKIASLPATQITGTITQVTFPAFASIQDDYSRLMRGFYKSLVFTLAVTLPLSMASFAFAYPLTLLIFGENWLELVPALRILCFYGVVRSVLGVLGPLTVAIGRPELITYSGLVRTIVLFALIIPLTNTWGIAGAAWATVISITISCLVLYLRLIPVFTGKTSQ